LPLGVLFRGNSEADIRRKIIQKGYIKAIIGLPANLFYGTGIAASLIVIDKEDAADRKEIFMIDASKGFIKDGNKNRLREQDIHKIVDTYTNRLTISKYSRTIPISEIADPKNDYNLNIPRYIDSQEAEDIQDIEAHLLGGIPKRDIDDLQNYWTVYPTMKVALFSSVANRPNYYQLNIANEEIKNTIFNHPEFAVFGKTMEEVFNAWETATITHTKALDKGLRPKNEIHSISENLLSHYNNKLLTDKYAMYQHLMDYWAETMQDDFYELAADGWSAGNELKRLEKKTKKGEKEIIRQVPGLEGLEGRLIPPALMIQVCFAKEQQAIDEMESQIENLKSNIEELIEENSGEDGLFAEVTDEKGKVTKAAVLKRMKEIIPKKIKQIDEDEESNEEYFLLEQYKELNEEATKISNNLLIAKADLEQKVIAQYPKLTIDEIKTIVVEHKWMAAMEQRIHTEMDNISHRLTQRIKELADRYETPMPLLTQEVEALTAKVENHLKQMKFVW
jgi:type I restriction enzyme M protein